MNIGKVSPLTVIFSFLYIAIGLELRKLEAPDPTYFRTFINTSMLFSVAAIWLVQLFINNGLFQNKNRHLMVFGPAIALMFAVVVFSCFPSVFISLFRS